MTRIRIASSRPSLSSFPHTASFAALVVGVLVLIGWLLDVAALKSVLPGLATMKVNTATAFILCGAALWLKQSPSLKPLSSKVFANLCAGAALLIGVLTLAEYLFGYQLGLDEWLIEDRATPTDGYPGRMSLATAASFVLLTLGLLTVDCKPRGYDLSAILAAVTGLISLLALVGYAYNVHLLYQLTPFSSMAMHTAGLFCLLSVALFLTRPIDQLAVQFSRLRYGLVPQVVTLVVATVIVVGGLISAVMVRQNQNTLRQQILTNDLASAQLAAEFASNYIDGARVTVRLFALSPFVEESVLDGGFKDITAELRKLLRWNRQLDGCSVFDAKGINRATGNIPASGLGNYSGDREWFQKTMATGEPYLGVPVISRGTDRPVLPYAVPIVNRTQQVSGVVICGISLAELSDSIAKYQTGPESRASLLDRRDNGIILAHPDRGRILSPVSGHNQAVTELLRGRQGAMETQDSSGAMNLAVFAPVPRLPWGVLILQPRHAAFAPIAQAARQSVYYTALLLLFTAAISGLLARRVTRPLLRLRTAAGRLGTGDLSARLNFTRGDEVGDLGRAFDQMAIALDERSAQLRAANEELQSQYRQVQDANRLKSEFLANMSHELRTPLNAIIGFTQLMHDRKLGEISAEQREYLNDILTSADHLLQLINDVLDLSKVEAGKLELNPEPVDLNKLIREVRGILQPLAAGKRLTVDFSVDDSITQVVIDSAKLKQILYNYLSNAIKFTEHGGNITMRATREGDASFRVEVEDTGIGIRSEEIEKLFAAFQQLDSGAAKKHQGTGLGLALSKKIAEALGGAVGVHSMRGKGSVFYVVLPTHADLLKETPGKDSPISELPEDAARILVIEDSEADRKWLSRILADAGYRVDIAKNGGEATDKSRNQAYTAILLDLILPDTGGWDILRAIRSAGPNCGTPVIVVTVVAEKGIAKGFPIQDYLVKPVHPGDLLESLRSAGLAPKCLQRKILVVDDDATTLKLAGAGLKACGYDVVCHSNAISALHDARTVEFDAVVLDLLMPEIDGFEFLDRFRRMDGCRHTPVIVWTSKDLTPEDLKRLKNAAQSVALKRDGGIDHMLEELARHAPPLNTDREAIQSMATTQ